MGLGCIGRVVCRATEIVNDAACQREGVALDFIGVI
jgi:hypothetical protein